jgi:hypothetical protein
VQTTEWHGVFAGVERPHFKHYRDLRPFLQVWKARRIAGNVLFARGSFLFLAGPAVFFDTRLALFFVAGFAFFFAIFFALIGNFPPCTVAEATTRG